MNRALKPIIKRDKTVGDFHATFGSAVDIPQTFNFDYVGQNLGVFPDQNADGLPNACVAYTTVGMASNNDKINYDDKNFTYSKTKLMMGVEGDVPTDQMTGLESATVYGVRKKGEGDADALGHRQAPKFIVKKLNGSYFDGIVSAMWLKQGTLSMGTYWPREFETITDDGLISDFVMPKNWSEGHNYEVCGKFVVESNGDQEELLIVKSWQGRGYGNKGYCYFNRAEVEKLCSGSGFGIFGQKHLEPGQDIVLVKVSLLKQLIDFIRQLIIKYQFGQWFGNLLAKIA